MSADRPAGGAELIARAFAGLAAEDVVFEVAGIGARIIHPREAALVAGAVESRRREFATGRWCAARALARVGAPPGPILRGPFHEPLWPFGFIGSIAHHGQVAAAAARALRGSRWTAIGIDLVDCTDLELYRGVADLIRCDRDDLGFVDMREPIAAAYLFSIKEAAVKCLSPALKTFVDLAKLRVCPASSRGCRIEYAGDDMRILVQSAQTGSFVVAFAEMGMV